MNLRKPNASEATKTANRSRNVVPMSGICSVCIDGCKGNCEIFKASFRGREVIYPGPFGEVTSGADKNYPVDYSHLNIQGYAEGAKGLPEGVEPGPDTATFPAVNTESEYGWEKKVKLRFPILTGALGSTEIARRNWEHFAVGAAITGFTIVCGENVCGVDPELELDSKGKVKKSPELDRRIETYKRYHEGYGEILVQLNVEDTRLNTAEYVIEKHGLETIELKWGQGAKSIGGEIKVKEIERALQLKSRGYIVTPDPTLPDVKRAHEEGEITEFERHSRLGFISREAFIGRVQELRKLGYKRITLKTGAYSMKELAMALRWGSEAQLDLITIDGAPGGTGMSPWVMMNEWGIPTIYLESLTWEFCEKLRARGLKVPDLAMGGGFSGEDGIFKAIALGTPYVKAVCLGRAAMIPGMVGKNIGEWLKERALPKTIADYGIHPEEIFVTYEELRDKFGDEVTKLPMGAIGIYTFTEKLRVGLQQIMAGSRNFCLNVISRKDLMSLTKEAAEITGIPYVMEAYREEAENILES
jgi:glutamate synthase domain-containing protein 2